MNQRPETADERRSGDECTGEGAEPFDYSYVHQTARIARYDDLRSAPRITEIEPAGTVEFIENLASATYEQAHAAGGQVPYTVIREVTENFIHARFQEIVVSILDGGNTIRFADQGPGIASKEKAQLPGFSSATEPMKRYIRGVGSGLPIVKEYVELGGGAVTIDDNLNAGSVVTISLSPGSPSTAPGARGQAQRRREPPMPPLTAREREFLALFASEGALGVTDLANLTSTPVSSTHGVLKKLEEAGLIEKTAGQKRILTDIGYRTASRL